MRLLCWQSLTHALFFSGVRTEEILEGMKAGHETGSQVFMGTLSRTGQDESVWILNMPLMSRVALMYLCYIELKSPGRSGINHPCLMFNVLGSRNQKRISKRRILTQWQEHFFKLWVSISEAGIKMGHQPLRKMAHINPSSAKGTGQQLHSSEPGSEKWLQLTAVNMCQGMRKELQTWTWRGFSSRHGKGGR